MRTRKLLILLVVGVVIVIAVVFFSNEYQIIAVSSPPSWHGRLNTHHLSTKFYEMIDKLGRYRHVKSASPPTSSLSKSSSLTQSNKQTFEDVDSPMTAHTSTEQTEEPTLSTDHTQPPVDMRNSVTSTGVSAQQSRPSTTILAITTTEQLVPATATTETLSPRITYPERKRTPYMLALHTAEQLTMSTYHFIEFLNIVYDWNFTGVEPFVYHSRMFALRSMHSSDINGSVYYHRLLNTSFMREKMSKCLHGNDKVGQNNDTIKLFVPMEEFLQQSKRNITLIYFSKHMNVVGKKVHAAADYRLSKTAKTSMLDCTKTLRESGLSNGVEKLLSQELLIENKTSDFEIFTVIQAFCIMPKVLLSLKDIQKYVLSRIHRDKSNRVDVSVVFVSWQGRFTRPFTDMKTVHHCDLPAHKIPPSEEVVSATNQFLLSLSLQSSTYIAIHIRFEKLFTNAYNKAHTQDPRQFLQCCMLKLDATLKQVKERLNLTADNTLFLHDYGRYGSDACHHSGEWKSRDICSNDVKSLLSLVNETKAVEFDPFKFASPMNSGFVSRVEALSLTGARVLIVAGGGSFQAAVVNRFRERHSGRGKETVLYRLCEKTKEKVPGINLNGVKDCTPATER